MDYSEKQERNSSQGQSTYRSLGLSLLRRYIRRGNLRVYLPNDSFELLGDGDGDVVEMTLPESMAMVLMLLHPDPKFCDAYVDKHWDTFGQSEVEDVIHLFRRNEELEVGNPLRILSGLVSSIGFLASQYSPPFMGRWRIKRHYDLGNDVFFSFLDPHKQYSCAFYTDRNDTLEKAQIHKLEVTSQRLDLDKPGLNVLDIGCGWGGLSRYLATTHDAHVTGITLSDEQLGFAREAREGLNETIKNRLNYELCDYRVHAPRNGMSGYDRIVSVGMLEHVGRLQLKTYFENIKRLLKPHGRAVIHSIVKPFPDTTSTWLRQNIFPGGYIPALTQEFLPAARAAGLTVAAVHEHAGENYQRTLDAWRAAFRRNRHTLPARYNERFCRVMEMYFGASINAFDKTQLGYTVAQVELTNA